MIVEEKRMKICPNCHLELDDKFRFCHQCGCKLENKVEAAFCPYCGNRIETEGEFCPYCGNVLTEEIDEKPTTQQFVHSTNQYSNNVKASNSATTVLAGIDTKDSSEVKDSEEPFFSIKHLFSYEGRRGRLSYLKVDVFWRILSEILYFFTLGSLPIMLVLALLLSYPQFCNIAKRMHDLNKPSSWALMLLILGQITAFGVHASKFLAMSNNTFLYGRLVIALIVFIPFLVLYFKEGTKGSNQFGSNPL